VLVSAYDDEDYFRRLWQEDQDRVLAACRAAGLLTGLTEPGYPGTCTERLDRIRRAVEDLRAALGLSPLPSTATSGTGGVAQ
jgi:hypothetical protein